MLFIVKINASELKCSLIDIFTKNSVQVPSPNRTLLPNPYYTHLVSL